MYWKQIYMRHAFLKNCSQLWVSTDCIGNPSRAWTSSICLLTTELIASYMHLYSSRSSDKEGQFGQQHFPTAISSRQKKIYHTEIVTSKTKHEEV